MQVNIGLDEDGTVVLSFHSSFKDIAMSLLTVLEEMTSQGEAFTQALREGDATPEQHLQMLLLEALISSASECIEAVRLSVPEQWFGVFPREQVNEELRQYFADGPSKVLMVGHPPAPKEAP